MPKDNPGAYVSKGARKVRKTRKSKSRKDKK